MSIYKLGNPWEISSFNTHHNIGGGAIILDCSYLMLNI